MFDKPIMLKQRTLHVVDNDRLKEPRPIFFIFFFIFFLQILLSQESSYQLQYIDLFRTSERIARFTETNIFGGMILQSNETEN